MQQQPVERALPPGQERRGGGKDHEDDRRPPPPDPDQIPGRGDSGVVRVPLDVGHLPGDAVELLGGVDRSRPSFTKNAG